MEHLTRADMERLQAAASRFGTDSHAHYIAEAVQCLDRTGNPVSALKLLHAIWDSPFAKRRDQKKALDDVGVWLEQRLGQTNAGAARIAVELGWLRRMCVIGRREARGPQEGAGNGAQPTRHFGNQLAALAQRYQTARKTQQQQQQQQQKSPEEKKPATPPPPAVLPPTFAAVFVDVLMAREAAGNARRRAKAGKAPSERLLPLKPTDPQLAPLAANLVCSTTATAGFDEVFTADGRARSFSVGEVDRREDGKLLARRILFSAR